MRRGPFEGSDRDRWHVKFRGCPMERFAQSATLARSNAIPQVLSYWANARPDSAAYSFVGNRTEGGIERHVRRAGAGGAVGCFAPSIQRTPRRPGATPVPRRASTISSRSSAACTPDSSPSRSYPPRPGAKMDRIWSVIRDCRPACALTNETMHPFIGGLSPDPGAATLRVETIEAVLRASHRAHE